MKTLLSLLIALASFSCHSSAPLEAESLPPGPQHPSPAWLTGAWTAEAFGGEVLEWWSPLQGNEMFGAFRLVSDQRTIFYELFNLVLVDGEWTMRLRHFNAPGLDGWEDADGALVWPCNALEERHMSFGPVTYTWIDEGRIDVCVVLEEGDRSHTESFTMVRP